MKRKKNLYQQIISKENLILADERARKGKEKTYGVRLHDKNRSENLEKLHKQLKEKTFKTLHYETFKITTPKEREIFRLPFYPDRIAHHAIMNILEPIWMKIFTVDTFSCIKNRGIHGAMRKVKKAMKDRENVKYCLKIDIKKYYPSIDHSILKCIVRKKIACKDTLWLLDLIIDSAPGVPIGNYPSQYFANLFLAYFDHWIKEEKNIKHYFRYADDMVFFAKDKLELHTLLHDITNYFQTALKLTIKENYQIFPLAKDHRDKRGRGLDFVGYVFYFNETRIRKAIKQNFCRAAAKMNKKPNVPIKQYKQALCSWFGWVKYSDSEYLFKKLIKEEHYEKCTL